MSTLRDALIAGDELANASKRKADHHEWNETIITYETITIMCAWRTHNEARRIKFEPSIRTESLCDKVLTPI